MSRCFRELIVSFESPALAIHRARASRLHRRAGAASALASAAAASVGRLGFRAFAGHGIGRDRRRGRGADQRAGGDAGGQFCLWPNQPHHGPGQPGQAAGIAGRRRENQRGIEKRGE